MTKKENLHKGDAQIMKKTLSLILAILMIVATMPMVFAVDEGAPVLIDPINDPPVATPVEAGARLNKSTISGGAVKHPTTGEVLNDAVWAWVSSRTKVNVSGYFQAYCVADALEDPLFFDIYVSIIGNAVETEFSVLPSITNFAYDGRTWENIILDGTVVEKGTENVVDGTFSITNKLLTSAIPTGTHEVNVKFTPNDTEKYLPCETTVSVTVSKGTPAWKDGADPVYKSSFGYELGRIDEIIEFANVDGKFYVVPYDMEGNSLLGKKLSVGTYTFKAKLNPDHNNPNWEEAYLEYTHIVTPVAAAFTDVSYKYQTETLSGKINSAYVNGTVDIFIDNELVFDDEPVNATRFKVNWKPEDISVDSTHDLKIVYNAAEGDNAVVKEAYTGTITYKAKRAVEIKHRHINVSANNSNYDPEIGLIAGQTVTVYAGLSDFRYWIVTDKDGNEVELEFTNGTSLADREFSFVMPEYDLVFDVVFQHLLDEQAKLDECECLCHSDNPIAKFFWNLILKLMDIFSQLFGYENVCDCGFAHGTTKAF